MKEKDLHITDERKLRKDHPKVGNESSLNDNRQSVVISPFAANFGSLSKRVIQNEVSRLQQIQSKRKNDVPSEIWLG